MHNDEPASPRFSSSQTSLCKPLPNKAAHLFLGHFASQEEFVIN